MPDYYRRNLKWPNGETVYIGDPHPTRPGYSCTGYTVAGAVHFGNGRISLTEKAADIGCAWDR